MSDANILAALNDKQQAAVATRSRYVRVLAGAGSGKTRVLVHRIAWLIEHEQVSPYAIMAVTFTNKAAREMRERLDNLLAIPTQAMWVGTFHGLAHRLLRAHWQDAGLNEHFQILDSDDQLRLIKRVIKERGLDDTRWSAKEVMWYINARKDEGQRPKDIRTNNDFYQQTLVKVYADYQAACERSGLVDFAELLLRAYELWREKPAILAHYQQRFKHVLVDEFQDTNAIQYAWLRQIVHDDNCLMIVGDDDQSIYGWRGAQIENIHRFSKDFPGSETVRLEQNYRSTATILAAANQLIDNNQERLGKKLWTQGEGGDPISLYAAFNEMDEARFICDRIHAHQSNNQALSEIAILYRSNAQSRVLEEALINAHIPYRIYGGLRFFDRAEIKDVLAYLRLLSNRDDDAAFERIVNTPTRGIGLRTLEAVRDYSRQQSCPLWQAASDLIQQQQLPSRAASALKQFIHLIDDIDEFTREFDLAPLAEHVLEVSGLFAHHANGKGEKAQARKENLQEFITASKHFVPDPNEDLPILAAFLSHAALEAGERQADAFQDCVQLMTLHSAKGLEFPVVFLAGVEEGLFPHAMSAEEPGRLEEERRLCYVGITRAMAKLYISYAQIRRQYQSEAYHRPSRFINELPSELIEMVRSESVVRTGGGVARPAGRVNKTRIVAEALASDTGFQLGQAVSHPKYGEGIILGYEGSGPHARVQVNFSEHGVKTLVLSYAKLEAI